ncbi:hypothetical protein [Hymenobacter terricola]|uniref:hypothetical protein n=1 Tax=Hymenobacter terricola TaxID=2819236 RepID=UPI001B30792A|nr:hypothetical protein [Hymenobacter terricola]
MKPEITQLGYVPWGPLLYAVPLGGASGLVAAARFGLGPGCRWSGPAAVCGFGAVRPDALASKLSTKARASIFLSKAKSLANARLF